MRANPSASFTYSAPHGFPACGMRGKAGTRFELCLFFDAFWGCGLLWAPVEAPLGILWVSFWVVLALFGRLWALCMPCRALPLKFWPFGVPFSGQMYLKRYRVFQKQASRRSAPELPIFSRSNENGPSTALPALGSTRLGPG